MALDLGVELKTSRKEGVIGRPEREPGMPDWDLAGASVQFSDRDLKVGLNGKAVLGQIQIIVSLSKHLTGKEIMRRFNERGGTYPIQLPPKWQHLPIPGPHRGYDPEVQKFTYLVSSYDDEGKLLPEFAKRMEEIEGKTSLAVSKPNSQPRQRGNGTPEIENRAPAKESWNKWIGVALLLVVFVFDFPQKKSATSITGKMTALEVGLDNSRSQVLKIEGRLRTVCLRHGFDQFLLLC